MPLPLLPSVFRVAITHGPGNSAGFTNVIHVSSAVLSPSQVLAALNTAAPAGIYDASTSQITAVEAVITKLDNTTPSIQGALTAPGWLGTGAGDISPASAAVVTLKTLERGRRHTGRIFIGAITEDKMANGALTTASQATMAGAWTTFVANLVSAGIPLNVTSYGHDGEPPPPRPTRPAFAASTVLVNVATVGTLLGTQRRRQSRLRN